MGCDIHAFTEYKTDNGWVSDQTFEGHPVEGKDWFDYEISGPQPKESRNYLLFGLLSQSCGRGRINYPVGIPFALNSVLSADSDAGLTAYYENWGSDAHSLNVITYTELREKLVQLLLHPEYSDELTYLSTFCESCPGWDDPTIERRLIIWFDN